MYPVVQCSGGGDGRITAVQGQPGLRKRSKKMFLCKNGHFRLDRKQVRKGLVLDGLKFSRELFH